MDTFVISQVSYWWTRYKLDPKVFVDRVIDIVVDVLVPPKDQEEDDSKQSSIAFFGQIVNKWNSIDRAAAKQEKAIRIRREIAKWDRENPDVKHDMIIKNVVPAFVSVLATTMYTSFCRRIADSRQR